MSMYINLEDIKKESNGYEVLLEQLELILVSYKLDDSYKDDYRNIITETPYEWIIRLPLKNMNNSSNGTHIFIPKVKSEYRPPKIKFYCDVLYEYVRDLNLFEREIADKSILIIKNDNSTKRGMGYSYIFKSQSFSYKTNWEFHFINQNALYDFYLICQSHGIF